MKNSDFEEPNPIVGTCQKLEKPYFRLSSQPDPSVIRPVEVLKKWFGTLIEQWNATNTNYDYILDQFKAIRQDLTVQKIKNDFSAQVYEKNAKISLENGDHGEFNLALTMLESLLREGVQIENQSEFLAYRILYSLVHDDFYKLASSLVLIESTNLLKEDCILHAFQVVTAVQLCDYHSFFVLYKSAPNLGRFVLEPMIQKMRRMTLKTITKGFRPTISTSYVRTELGFVNIGECLDYLQENKVLLDEEKSNILCKETFLAIGAEIG